jgi:hypothetical protein
MRSPEAFGISGMGGTMVFSDFRVMGRVDALSWCVRGHDDKGNRPRLSFLARASCLRLKGNGTAYRFSKDVVNKLCDRWMNTCIVGTCEAALRLRAQQKHESPLPEVRRRLVSRLAVPVGIDGTPRVRSEVSSAPSCPPAQGTLVFVDGELLHNGIMEDVIHQDDRFVQFARGSVVVLCIAAFVVLACLRYSRRSS